MGDKSFSNLPRTFSGKEIVFIEDKGFPLLLFLLFPHSNVFKYALNSNKEGKEPSPGNGI